MTDTPIADMVEAMLSGGIPPEQVLLAIRAVELTTSHSKYNDPVAARRRAWDREYRRSKKSGIPPEDPKTHSLSSSPSTDLEKKGKKERKSGNVCPPEFHPKANHYVLGQELSQSRIQVDAMCDDMKAWSQANANRAIARKADWDLTLTGWMKRNAKPKTNGGHHGKRSLSDAADELIARAEGFERTIDLVAEDIPRDRGGGGEETGRYFSESEAGQPDSVHRVDSVDFFQLSARSRG